MTVPELSVYNILAGRTCLEDLELRRNDEAYLNALGAIRIPDLTTAGDFCRRFQTDEQVLLLMVWVLGGTILRKGALKSARSCLV